MINAFDYFSGYDSRQEIDLLVDRFQKASVRRKEKEYEIRKKKKRSDTPQQKEPQGSFQLQKAYEDSSESQICQGPTLRFMKKVLLLLPLLWLFIFSRQRYGPTNWNMGVNSIYS